jgi:4-diphosphocytidyl-2-C-methyl-D-erythritol kinase
MKQQLLAPAKINLCLHVLGKRADGYHDLAMLMQRVSVFDRLDVTVGESRELAVVCTGVPLAPDEENIAARAVRRLLEAAGVTARVGIEIDKRIPVAAGLGGGSSDAAAILVGLNRLLDLGFDQPTLMKLGRELGADVPFFVYEQTAWATGIGDVLDPVPQLPPFWCLLVNPGIPVSTAWAYRNLGLTSPRDVARLRKFPATLSELVRLLHNDLERVTIGHHPLLAEIKHQLVALGALGALMSGSGPTLFGVFESETAAHRAEQEMRQRRDWWVCVAEPLPDGPVCC